MTSRSNDQLRERSRGFLGDWMGIIAFASLLAVSSFAACNPEEGEPCANASTEVSATGARLVLSTPLPFEPGPVAVVSRSEAGDQVSRSGRVWLGEGGLDLYAARGQGVWRIDLATLESSRVGKVDGSVEAIIGAEADDALLVTDSGTGALWVLDRAGEEAPVRIPLGANPAAVALGPGNRLAYVTNPGTSRLDLVDTGVGLASPEDRLVLVGAAREGALLALDGDGRIRARHDGLPARLHDLAVLADGRVVASYSDLVVTGDPGVIGDGLLVLDEGLCVVDLGSGAVERLPFARAAGSEREGSLAWPSALAPLADGTVVVALPGWGAVAQMDVDPESPTYGGVLREIPLSGRPRDLAPGSLKGDWLYVLDESGDTLSIVGTSGEVTERISLP